MGLSNSKICKLFCKPRSTKTTPPFPLFKLPKLAIVAVLMRIELLELIQLSFASERTRNIVKSFVRNSSRNNNKLHLEYENHYKRHNMNMDCEEGLSLKIRFRTKDDGLDLSEYREDSKLSKIFIKLDGITVPIKINHDKYIITVYYDNYTTAVKTFLRYFCRIFKPLISINFCKEDELLVTEVLDVIKKEKAKLDSVWFSRRTLNDHLYQMVLELPMRKMDLFPYASENFQYKLSDKPIKIEELQILEAQWVRPLEDFLHCKKVALRNTRLSEPDLNRFLKKWMESDCQLEFLHVYMLKPNLREIVKGVQVESVNRVCIDNNFENFEDGKCFSFQRSSGEKTYIYEVNSTVIIQNESCQHPPFSPYA